MTYRVDTTGVTFWIGGRELCVDADRATFAALGDHHAPDADVNRWVARLRVQDGAARSTSVM